jgi:hypothetical protein
MKWQSFHARMNACRRTKPSIPSFDNSCGSLLTHSVLACLLASPTPAAEHPPLWGLLFLQPVTLSAEVVDFGVHPPKEEFGRGRGDPRPLKPDDFLPLAPRLDAHVFDFPSYMVEVWCFWPRG